MAIMIIPRPTTLEPVDPKPIDNVESYSAFRPGVQLHCLLFEISTTAFPQLSELKFAC
jgi:hypothetical protein